MTKQEIRLKIEEEIKKNLEDIYIEFSCDFTVGRNWGENKDIPKIKLDENDLTKLFMSKINFSLNKKHEIGCKKYYNEVIIHKILIKILSENINDLTEEECDLLNLLLEKLENPNSLRLDSLLLYKGFCIFFEFKRDDKEISNADYEYDWWKIIFYHFIFWIFKGLNIKTIPLFSGGKKILIDIKENNFYGIALKYIDPKKEFEWNIFNISNSNKNVRFFEIINKIKNNKHNIRQLTGANTFDIDFGEFNAETASGLLIELCDWVEQIEKEIQCEIEKEIDNNEKLVSENDIEFSDSNNHFQNYTMKR